MATPTQSLTKTNSLDQFLEEQAAAAAVQVEQPASPNPAQTGFLLKPFVPTPIQTYLDQPLQSQVFEDVKPAPEIAQVELQDQPVELLQAQPAIATIRDPQPMIAGSITVTPRESRSWTVSLWNAETQGNKIGFAVFKVLVGILFILGDLFINLPFQAYDYWKSSKAAVKQISLNQAPVVQPTITLQPVPAPTASANSVEVTDLDVFLGQAPSGSDEVLIDGGAACFEDAILADLLASQPAQQAPVAQATPALDKLAKLLGDGLDLTSKLKTKPAPEVTEEEVDLGAFFAQATRSAPQPKKIFSPEAVRAAYPSEAEKRAAKAEAAKAKAEAARIAAEPARINKLFKTIRSKEAGMYAQLGQVQQKMRNDYLDRHELDSRLAKKLGSIRDAGKNTKTTDPIIDRFNRECEVEGEKLAAFAAGPKPITQKVGNETLTVRGETENSVNILTAVDNLKKRLNSVLFKASYTTREGVDVEANVQAFDLILKTADKNALQNSFLTSVTREMHESQEQGQGFLTSILSAIAKIDAAIDLGVVSEGVKPQFLADNYTKLVIPALRKEFQDDVAQIGFDAAIENIGTKIDQIHEIDTNPNLDDAYLYQKIFKSTDLISDLIEGERQKRQTEVGYSSSVLKALDQIRVANRLIGLSDDGQLGHSILESYLVQIDYRNNFLPELRNEFARYCDSGADVLEAIGKFYNAIRSSNQVSQNEILPLIKDDIQTALMKEFHKRANPPGLVSAGPDLKHFVGKQLLESISKVGFGDDVRQVLEETVQTAIYEALVSETALLMIEQNQGSLEDLDFLREGLESEGTLDPARAANFNQDVQAILNDDQERRAEAARIVAEQQAQEAAQAAQNAAIQQALLERTELETIAAVIENNLERFYEAMVTSATSLVQAREVLGRILPEMDTIAAQFNALNKPLADNDGTIRSFAEWNALHQGNPEAGRNVLGQLQSAYAALDKRKNEVLVQIVNISRNIAHLHKLYMDEGDSQSALLAATPQKLGIAKDLFFERLRESQNILALASESMVEVNRLTQTEPQASLVPSNQPYGNNAALTSVVSSQPASPVATGRTSPLSLTIVPSSKEIASENESIREEETPPVSADMPLGDGEEDLLQDLIPQDESEVVKLYRPAEDYVFAGTPPASPK